LTILLVRESFLWVLSQKEPKENPMKVAKQSLAVVCVLSFLLPAFVRAADPRETLTLGMTADIQGWDPGIQPGYQGWAGEAVWDTLVKADAFGHLAPDIADRWSISSDNRTFRAHIRNGMKFSDGTPVDSYQVAATFEYLGKNGQSTNDYKDLTIKTPDPQNITLTWKEPQPLMNQRVFSPKITTKALLASGKLNDVPIGSGPYVLDASKTTRGSVYTFTKNEKHWNSAKYPFKKLVLKVIESEAATVSALKTGQIDASLVSTQSYNEVTASGLSVIEFRGQTTRLLLTDRLGKIIPALGDVRVRRAINMVFDKEAMVKNLYGGRAEPAYEVFRKGSDASLGLAKDPYPFDVKKAQALMAEAGYAQGFDLQLPTMAGQNFETLMPYITQQLGLLNINVKQVPLSGANAIADLLSGKYPVVLWQLGNFGDSKLDVYICMTPAGWWDLEHQPDATVDAAWTKIVNGNAAKQKAAQKEIAQYVVDQAWFAPMVHMGSVYAYNPKAVSIPTQSDVEGLTPKLRDFN
jgi:peptide/nickel transport system substrate-binding protein